jgi:hypothetical protein
MTTILYNSDSKKFISDRMDSGYLVDGKHQSVYPPIYELSIVDIVQPAYDVVTQKIDSNRVIDLSKKEWRLEWVITNKSPNELIEDVNKNALDVDDTVRQMASERLIDNMAVTIRSEAKLLSDSDALNSANLFPPYKIGQIYNLGDRFYYPFNNKLYKVIGASHTSQLDWKPTTAISLYVEVTPPGVIAPWKQPGGAYDAYKIGDKVTFDGFTWESVINANVWSPTTYPAGWKKI